ncbi:MAG: hypothetical protein HY717_05465 [Planctomycetes bacterium]|nr:hypothetical protein [Planctomycetota bacterium]
MIYLIRAGDDDRIRRQDLRSGAFGRRYGWNSTEGLARGRNRRRAGAVRSDGRVRAARLQRDHQVRPLSLDRLGNAEPAARAGVVPRHDGQAP